jgi:hypothetical protein
MKKLTYLLILITNLSFAQDAEDVAINQFDYSSWTNAAQTRKHVENAQKIHKNAESLVVNANYGSLYIEPTIDALRAYMGISVACLKYWGNPNKNGVRELHRICHPYQDFEKVIYDVRGTAEISTRYETWEDDFVALAKKSGDRIDIFLDHIPEKLQTQARSELRKLNPGSTVSFKDMVDYLQIAVRLKDIRFEFYTHSFSHIRSYIDTQLKREQEQRESEKEEISAKVEDTSNNNPETNQRDKQPDASSKTTPETSQQPKQSYTNTSSSENTYSQTNQVQQKTAEQLKREEEARIYQENLKRKQAYDREIQARNSRNIDYATGLGTASASTLVMIGTLIYQDMGKVRSKFTYFGNQMNLGVNFGYSFTGSPIIYNSDKRTLTFDGDYETTEEDVKEYFHSFNLEVNYFMGYEHDYGGVEAEASFKPGLSIWFTDFNVSNSFNGTLYGGWKPFKAYYNFEFGNRRFNQNWWINSEQFGTGEAHYRYRRHQLGLRITNVNTAGTYARNHINIGWIMERYLEPIKNDRYHYRAYLDDRQMVFDPSEVLTHGIHFDWTKEHNHRLYLNFYPNFPMIGRREFRPDRDFTLRREGGQFLEFGFIRQLKYYF